MFVNLTDEQCNLFKFAGYFLMDEFGLLIMCLLIISYSVNYEHVLIPYFHGLP